MKLSLFILVASATLVSCSLISPEQHAALQEYFNQELAAGRITQEQYDALMQTLSGGGWSNIVEAVVSTVLGIAGSLIGVRFLRGPATKNENIMKAAIASRVQTQVTPVSPPNM